MPPLHRRTQPRFLFFSSGLLVQHLALLRITAIYAVFMGLFAFMLWRLGQFSAIPVSTGAWQTLGGQLSSVPMNPAALAALAQLKTAVIMVLTIYIVFRVVPGRIALCISRWRIDSSLARAGNEAFLEAAKDKKARTQEELLSLVPQGDSSLSSLRAFQRLIQNTTLVAQDPPAGIVETVRATVEEEAHRNSSAQRLLLQLGILGTFLGLVCATPSLNSIIGEHASDADVAAGLKNLFAALATCFSTSIAGLCGSIAVISAGNILRKAHEEHLRVLDDALLTLQAVVGDSLLKSAGGTEIGAIWQALHMQNERLQAQNEVITKGMASLGDVKAIFDTLSQSVSHTAAKMGEMQAQLSGPELAKSLSASLASAIAAGRDSLAANTEKAAEAMQAAVSAADGLGKTMEANRDAARAEADRLQATYTKLSSDLLNQVRDNQAGALNTTLGDLAGTVATLQAELRAHETAMNGSPWYRMLHWAALAWEKLRAFAIETWNRTQK